MAEPPTAPQPPPPTPPPPSSQSAAPTRDSGGSRFKVVARTQEEEDAFDPVAARHLERPSSVFSTVVQLVKGALGAGILSGHVAYMEGGLITSLILNVLLGIYMTYSLLILVQSAQVLYRRTHVPTMTYSDLGEAAFACHPNRKIQRLSKCFRYTIDIVIGIDLFGSCVCYQLMVSQQLKQLVENVQKSIVAGKFGYPNLRIYMLAMIIPFVCVCLIRHLEWLSKVSLIGNILVLICIVTTVYYSVKENPTFQGMVMFTSIAGSFNFVGLIVFSMACAGVVLPAENNMKEPMKYPQALFIGMTIIVASIIGSAFFGYNAYLNKSKAPITLNFPMETLPKILKVVIALNIYATHGINFWVPYELMFHYLKRLHPPHKEVRMDYVYRTITCIVIAIIGIIFPDVPKVMSFIGCFCLSNMAFIWPSLIQLLIVWERPGLGKMKWRLVRALVLILIGLFIFFAGSAMAVVDLASLFTKSDKEE